MSTYLGLEQNFQPIQSGTLINTNYTVPVNRFSLVQISFNTVKTTVNVGANGNTSSYVQSITINGSTVLFTEHYIHLTNNNSVLTCNDTEAIVYGSDSDANSIPLLDYYSFAVNGTGVAYYKGFQSPNKIKVFLKSGDTVSGANMIISFTEFSSQNLTTISGAFKPFYYEPVQTIVASSSYTVPVGKYAKVIHYHVSTKIAGNSTALKYPNTNVLFLSLNGVNIRSIDNEVPVNYEQYEDAKAGTVINDYTKSTKITSSKLLEYYAKAGDVISGTGNWRAIISLYDVSA